MRKIAIKLIAYILSMTLMSSAFFAIDTLALSNEEVIYNFIINELGLNMAAACGILANIEHESGFDNTQLERGYTWEEGAGYGICQWTNYPRTASYGRRTNLVDWCSSEGYDYKSLTGQLYFLKHELEINEKKGVYPYMQTISNNQKGAYDAGYYWCFNFEVPADKEKNSKIRGNRALEFWSKYSGELIERNLCVTSPYMTGSDVTWVQECLCKLGYTVTVDGIYGNDTADKVKRFQSDNGLTADGICGDDTRNKLKEKTTTHTHKYTEYVYCWKDHPHYKCYRCSCGDIKENRNEPTYVDTCAECNKQDNNPYPEPTRNLSLQSPYCTGDDVKWVQWWLVKRGYNIDIDGIYGHDTHTQVAHFQRDNGLTVDGICGAGTRSKLKEITPHIHNYSVSARTEPTCTQNGSVTYKCSCGASYSETLNALGHSYTTRTVSATCITQGYTLHTCSRCGNNYKDTYTNALGHDYKLTTQKAATCTADGEKIYTCSRCGSTKTETVKATGHNYTTKVITATCTAQGYTLHTCSNCGSSYKDTYTNALGHDYKLTSQKAATCTTDGEKIYTCSRCGSTKTETVKATGHSYTTKVIAATCITQGYTLHTCSNCGNSYKDTYISASDHDYSLTSQKVATCTANGEKIYICNHCGSTKTETIKATGHKYTETVVAPTSTEQGYTLHTCSVCGHSYKDNYTDKLLEQLVNNSTLSAEAVKLGETVTVSAKASGGAGSYQYNVLYKQKSQSKWTTAQAYKANTTVSIKPATATTYDICVKVKDSNGTEVKKYFTVKVTNALQNNSTISNTEINLGDTITVNGKATGGTGGYTYAVYYKKTSDSKWSTAQAYKNNSTVAIKPINATTYDICVKIKDSDGTEVKKYFNVKVTDPMKNVSIISSTSVTLGDTITVTGKASGGTNFYVYAVYSKESQNTKWTVVQDYSSNSIVMIKPDKATKYNICVKVKDSSGTIEKKYFDVTVNPKLSELINTSKLSTTSIKLGDTIQVICSAQGGTGFYQYAIYYKKINDTKWTTKQSYSPNSITDIKPPESSVYDVCIKVKDNLNNENKKYFTLTVK